MDLLAVGLQRVSKRDAERPEGSHHLSEQDFRYLSSLFQPPEEDEGFTIEHHNE